MKLISFPSFKQNCRWFDDTDIDTLEVCSHSCHDMETPFKVMFLTGTYHKCCAKQCPVFTGLKEATK